MLTGELNTGKEAAELKAAYMTVYNHLRAQYDAQTDETREKISWGDFCAFAIDAVVTNDRAERARQLAVEKEARRRQNKMPGMTLIGSEHDKYLKEHTEKVLRSGTGQSFHIGFKNGDPAQGLEDGIKVIDQSDKLPFNPLAYFVQDE